MKDLRALIVDDEPLARRVLHTLLENSQGIEIVGECRSGIEAVDVIRRERPDLVFLDVQMPEMNGFQVLEKLDPNELPGIIFVTAYDQFALKAFEVHAIDYLLKPFDDVRFSIALERARTQICQDQHGDLRYRLMLLIENWNRNDPSRKPPNNRLLVRETGKISFIAMDEIDWIEASDQYVTIHSNSKTYLIRESMQDLEKHLPEGHFFRIHRSFLVNLESVKELQIDKQGEYHAVLKDGSVLKVSRSKRNEFEAALG